MSSIHTSKKLNLHDTIWSLKLSENPITTIYNKCSWYNYSNSPVGADCISFSATTDGSFCRIQSPNIIAGVNTVVGKRVVMRFLCKNSSNSQVAVALKYDSPSTGGLRNTGINNLSGTYDWTETSVMLNVPEDAKIYEITIINNGVVGSVPTGNCYVTGLRFTTLGPYETRPAIDPTFNSTISGCRGFNVEHTTAKDSESEFYELRSIYNCNIIRFPLTKYSGDGFTDAPTNMNTYDLWFDSMMIALDKFLDKCKRNDIKIIVDYHFPPGGWGLLPGVNHALEYNNVYYDKFLEKWRYITNKLKDNPVVFAFDVLNEPAYVYTPPPQGPNQKNWYTVTIDAVREIRKIDPNRTIIYEPDGFSEPFSFKSLAPIPFDNVIYSVHMYGPSGFLNINNVSSIPYPGTINGDVFDKEYLRNILQPARDFQLAYKIPSIFVGEFAPYRWNPGAALWIRDLLEIFNEWGWIYTYFVYKHWQDVDLELENEKGTTVKSLSGTDRQRYYIAALSANNSLYTTAEQAPIAPILRVTSLSNKNSIVEWDFPDRVANEFVVEWKDNLSSTYSNIHTSSYTKTATTSAHIPGNFYDYKISLVNKYGSATSNVQTIQKDASYIKNLISNNVVRGFSLKRLTSAYYGPLIRVRRSSDDVELDVYSISALNLSAGFIDSSALMTFIGVNSGYVVTWYDQFNGNHITNPNKTRQPLIVSGGTLIQSNNYPSVYFNNSILSGVSTNFKSMSATTLIGTVKNISTLKLSYLAGDNNTSTNAPRYCWINGNVKPNEIKLYIANDAGVDYSVFWQSVEVSSFTSGVTRQLVIQDNRTNIKVASNKVQTLTTDNTFSSQLSATTLTTNVFCVGGFYNSGTPSAFINCNISELIFLGSVLSAEDYSKLMYSGILTYDLL